MRASALTAGSNALHDTYVAALKKGCEVDKNALLVGVIDDDVAEVLAKK